MHNNILKGIVFWVLMIGGSILIGKLYEKIAEFVKKLFVIC